jgi:hypothetical protein
MKKKIIFIVLIIGVSFYLVFLFINYSDIFSKSTVSREIPEEYEELFQNLFLKERKNVYSHHIDEKNPVTILDVRGFSILIFKLDISLDSISINLEEKLSSSEFKNTSGLMYFSASEKNFTYHQVVNKKSYNSLSFDILSAQGQYKLRNNILLYKLSEDFKLRVKSNDDSINEIVAHAKIHNKTPFELYFINKTSNCYLVLVQDSFKMGGFNTFLR